MTGLPVWEFPHHRKVVHICTGMYTYKDRDGDELQAHVLYALMSDGTVWARTPVSKRWEPVDAPDANAAADGRPGEDAAGAPARAL